MKGAKHKTTMRKQLEKISIAKMCNVTGLDVNRIRNYLRGRVAYLTPEETNKIIRYFNQYLTLEKKGEAKCLQ